MSSYFEHGSTWMYQMGARYYDPDGGWFTQADPLPSQIFGNRHSYTGGDPVNHSDPSGSVAQADRSRTWVSGGVSPHERMGRNR